MGANVPFGFVQLGPTSIPQTWDWCSGYNYADTTVIGFGHTHLSGTGIGDLNDISLMPVVGEVTPGRGTAGDPSSGMWSRFSRADERCAPGYYATRLLRYGIGVELTASPRVGMSRYAFPASDDAGIVLDLENGQGWTGPPTAASPHAATVRSRAGDIRRAGPTTSASTSTPNSRSPSNGSSSPARIRSQPTAARPAGGSSTDASGSGRRRPSASPSRSGFRPSRRRTPGGTCRRSAPAGISKPCAKPPAGHGTASCRKSASKQPIRRCGGSSTRRFTTP